MMIAETKNPFRFSNARQGRKGEGSPDYIFAPSVSGMSASGKTAFRSD